MDKVALDIVRKVIMSLSVPTSLTTSLKNHLMLHLGYNGPLSHLLFNGPSVIYKTQLSFETCFLFHYGAATRV